MKTVDYSYPVSLQSGHYNKSLKTLGLNRISKTIQLHLPSQETNTLRHFFNEEKATAMIIKIKNWGKFNPKRDQNSFTWLRLNNDLYSGQDFIEYSAQELAVWCSILCEASKKNSEVIEVKEKYILQCARCDSALFNSTLKKLIDDKYLELQEEEGADESERGADAEVRHTTPTNERTNVTNETNVTVPRLDPEKIINIFNEVCAAQGKIRRYDSYSLSPIALVDFMNRSGSPGYQGLDDWKKVFVEIAASDFLTGINEIEFVSTLPWILKPDNFEKIIGGQYQNKDSTGKAAKQALVDAGAKADTLFDRIIRNGKMNYGKLKEELLPLDLMAIENVGGLAPIFDCTNFTMEKVKAQFRAAYKQALEASA